jgi:cytochrome b561
VNPAKPVLVAVPSLVWRYSPLAMALHWLLAVLLFGTAGLGLYMMSIEEQPGSGWYFDLHKSIGVVISVLVATRLIWRLRHRPAALPASMPAWQRRAALITQWLLYGLMVAMPLAGYLGSAYSKAGMAVFGAMTPRWAVPDHDRAEQFFGIHEVLFWCLAALVTLHVLGALKHLWVDKDGVFQRMGWRTKA